MMRDCADGDTRDLLPQYVHGTLSAPERAAVAAHIGTCADCAAEAELIATASRLFPAPVIDVDRIVASLPAPPRVAGRAPSTGRVWRAAAAIGVIALGAYSVVALRGFFSAPARQGGASALAARAEYRSPTDASAPSAIVVHDDARQAASLAAAAATARGPGLTFGGGLADLTDDQLDTLLGELSALDPLPDAEPESHFTPIAPPADGGNNAR